jgi:GGDEF domain-containing protein
VAALATLGLLWFFAASGSEQGKAGLAPVLSLAWCALLVASSVYLGTQSWDAAGPWKWWLLCGHTAGLVVAMIFLADTAASNKSHWPVVLMLLLQLPPVYLSLVWRSRLLNESRLRSSAAEVIDPLTGLATTPVLIERLMRIMSRVSAAKPTSASSALFLIHVQNWSPLLGELGAEFSEKLLLEAALRLRRSIGDNDMAARIAGGRFAVIAQGLADQGEVAAMATRLVVSGLRIDSPLLPGVEFRFRVVVRPLRFARPLTLPEAQQWLVRLADSFAAWPQSHRSRSILVAEDDGLRPEVGLARS